VLKLRTSEDSYGKKCLQHKKRTANKALEHLTKAAYNKNNGVECFPTWIRNVNLEGRHQKTGVVACEMWLWIRMFKISWREHVSNVGVLTESRSPVLLKYNSKMENNLSWLCFETL